MFKIFRQPLFYLGLIIIIGFLVRLYKIDNPIADWHSWRQADTAAVARNFFKDGWNPLYPKYDDVSGVAENPIPNPGRFRFVEFPIYNSLVYFAYVLNGGVKEELARLINVFISLGSLVLIYFLVKRYSEKVALLSALLFAILPYNIYFSRVVLPEPILVFFSLGLLLFTDLWIWQGKKWQMILGLIFSIGAFLTKPEALFYALPLIYSVYQKDGHIWPIKKKYLLFFCVSVIPFLLWRVWILQHPEGIPAAKWLFNGNHIRFKPIFWQWVIQDRFGREILTTFGSILFFIGLLKKPLIKENYFLHILALSSLLYLMVLATGNVQHDYYQTFIIPALVIFTARGFWLLVAGIDGFVSRVWTIPLGLLFLGMMIYTGWGQIKGLYQINNPVIIEAGQEADKILPKTAIVMAPYSADTSFLYQTNRPGLAFYDTSFDHMIKTYGITDLVSVAKDAKTKYAMQKYKVLEDNSRFTIVDLTQVNPNFKGQEPQ